MTQNRIDTFLTVLGDSQLLEPNQVEELAKTPEAKAADLNGLAKYILHKTWLTHFQLTLISQGKTKELMLGPYRLIDRLGEGGMGQVFKAFHQPMNRTVALKVIRKEKLASQQAVQRFFREIQAAGKLVHPNIVVAFDANQVNGTHYFAMEYVEGIDLAKLVKQNGPLPVPVACDYIRQAALGLQHAHEQGMVHRDIKPHNLLVTQAKTDLSASKSGASSSKLGHKAVVKILDMGLARLNVGQADHGLTQDGAIIGTPEYIPPEQARDSRAADIRADLYSLGATFFFLLTGRPPFQAGTLAEILLKHQMDAPPDVRQLRAEVPADVASIVARLLAKKPEERFQTPQDLAQALEPICQGGINPNVLPQRKADGDIHDSAESSGDSPSSTQVQARTTMGRQVFKPKTDEPKGPNKVLLVGLAVAALVLIAVIALLVIPRGDSIPGPVAGNTGTEPGPALTGGAEPPAAAEFNLKLPATLTMNTGEQRLLRVEIERVRGSQAISLTLSGLPQGVFSQPVTIEPNKDNVDVLLMAAATTSLQDTEVKVQANNGLKTVEGKFNLSMKRGSSVAPIPVTPPTMVAPPPVILARGELRRITCPGFTPSNLCYLPGSRHALTATTDSRLRIWDMETTREVRVLAGNGGVKSITVSADGGKAFAVFGDGSAVLWDVEMGQEIRRFQVPTWVMTAILTPDARYAITAGGRTVDRDGQKVNEDSEARVWDLNTGKEVCCYEGHKGGLVTRSAVSPDGDRVLTYGIGGNMHLWELTTTRSLAFLNVGQGVNKIHFTPDGRQVCLAIANRVEVRDSATLNLQRTVSTQEALIANMAISPDGRYLLTCGGGTRMQDGQFVPVDCTVRLWEIESGKEIKRFEGHTRPVNSVAFTADGRFAVSASNDLTIRQWDLGLPPMTVLVRPPPAPVQKQEPPDAAKQAEKLKLIKDLYKDDYARIKLPERRELAAKLLGVAATSKDDPAARFVLLRESADIAAAAGHADGALKAIDQMAEDFLVDVFALKVRALTAASKVMNLPAMELMALAEAMLGVVDEAAQDEKFDQALLLTSLAESAARRASIVPLITRAMERAKDLRETQKEAAASNEATATLKDNPDEPAGNLVLGKYLCFRQGDWDTGLVYMAKGSDKTLEALAKKDLTSPKQARAQVEVGDAWWDAAAAAPGATKVKYQQRAGHWYQQATAAGLTGLALERVKSRLKQVPSLDGPASDNSAAIKLTGHVDKILSLAVSPDGKQAITGGAAGSLKLWDLVAAKELGSFSGPKGQVRGVAFSPDGKQAVSGSSDNTGVYIWDVANRQVYRTFVQIQPVNGVAFTNDSNWILYIATGSVRSYAFGLGSKPTYTPAQAGSVHHIAFSPAGRLGLCGCDDNSARLWEIDTAREQVRFLGHTGPVLSVAISKDGRSAVTGSADRTVRLWDPLSGKPVRTFKGHQGSVTGVAISADGRSLLSGSDDRTVRLWDAKSGKELRRFTGHDDTVTAVALSSDGRYVLSACADKVLRLWDLKAAKR